MSDDNNLQHGHAVREPQVGERVEMQASAAAPPLDRSAESPEETATGDGDAAESSPLGAFRHARLNPSIDAAQAKSIPSLPTRSESAAPQAPDATSETEEARTVAARNGKRTAVGDRTGPRARASFNTSHRGSAPRQTSRCRDGGGN